MRESRSSIQIFSAIQLLCKKLRKPFTESSKYKTRTGLAPASLVVLLSLGGVSWLVEAAIAPSIVSAYTARVDVSLNRQIGESYDTLLRRAEALARAAAQRSFDQDILVTDVAVTVLGQNEGAIAPLLSLEVTRQAWKSSPDPQRWAKYYPSAQSLLLLEGTAGQPGGQPGVLTAPIAPPPPPPPPGVAPQTVPGTIQDRPPTAPQQPGGAAPSGQPAPTDLTGPPGSQSPTPTTPSPQTTPSGTRSNPQPAPTDLTGPPGSQSPTPTTPSPQTTPSGTRSNPQPAPTDLTGPPNP